MAIQSIDVNQIKNAFLAGAQSIERRKDYINQLNVFPVPDGDTGTNMTLTIMSAADEIRNIQNPTMENLSKAISSGSLRGARGNSGVILSQLARGFCKETKGKTKLTTEDLALCFDHAVKTAYKAVMKPKEGTILTVAKGMAERAAEICHKTKDIEVFGKHVIEYGNEVLLRTPDMLPVLKEAGVVDSGGQGLMEFMQGAYNYLIGKEEVIASPVVKMESSSKYDFTVEDDPDAVITFGYCTEFIIMLEKEYTEENEAEFKEYLSSIGDSLVVVSDDDIVKVHVHTNHPGLAFEKGLTFGSLIRMKIDNMREEHKEKVARSAKGNDQGKTEPVDESPVQAENKAEPRKSYGFISVSVGEGMNELFRGFQVDELIEGGQTMNPSTDDLLQAISHVNADMIFILPNNKNIILAANQARSLVKDKEIVVIPSKTIPQGISALIAFDPEQGTANNESAMTEALQYVKTGQVTYAVRDTSVDGKTIATGDIMGIGDDKILTVGSEVYDTTLSLVDAMVDEDSELICLYYGQEVTKEDAENVRKSLTEKYTQCDIELQYGGQPIYYYVISVE